MVPGQQFCLSGDLGGWQHPKSGGKLDGIGTQVGSWELVKYHAAAAISTGTYKNPPELNSFLMMYRRKWVLE